jgi:hypothetical protein
MKIGTILKMIIPFILGLLIGSGFTKNNPYVMYIMIGYIISMVLFSLLKDKIMKVKNAENKKDELKKQGMEAVKDVGEITLKGNQRGSNLFDKYYGEYIFYINLALFLTLVILAFFKLWLWVLVCFLGLQFHMVLNQNVRMTKEIKEGLKNGNNK